MAHHWKFAVSPQWKPLLQGLGLDVSAVLQQAQLPGDLFDDASATLSPEAYFRLWRAIETSAANPDFPLSILKALNSDAFTPALFAAYCSPDLNTALRRLKQYKPLVCPMVIDLDQDSLTTRVSLRFLEHPSALPGTFVAMELGFFVHLARMATGQAVVPVDLSSPVDLPDSEAYYRFFGLKPRLDRAMSVAFTAADASRAFKSANQEMWSFFEPGLRKRLTELEQSTSLSERVRQSLLELLPAGDASVDALANRLNVSRRTLQRRLTREGLSVQDLIGQVRLDLARFYIRQSHLPYAQISFLLGYADPNSFFRAFHQWTGTTPDAFREVAVS
ncbi:MAG: AraC family transcriptional regulator [Saccharospirillum sp.]